MPVKISYSENIDSANSQLFIFQDVNDAQSFLTEREFEFTVAQSEKKEDCIIIDQLDRLVAVILVPREMPEWRKLEKLRINGDKVQRRLGAQGYMASQVSGTASDAELLAFAEGFMMSAYDFTKYKTAPSALKKMTDKLIIVGRNHLTKQLRELETVVNAVFVGRDWINEPVNALNAPTFAQQMAECSRKVGITATIGDKSWIERERMGGLLAVNMGSIDEPTFTILEWKPANAVNTKPLVMVGKGIVFDTGGISLKDTAFMDWMKSDMGGAAAIAGAILAIAGNKLPAHVIALIPATDNRPSGNAYVPGDVIRMRSGKTVEVLNTDAEGRMILADALDYAESLNPDLIVDAATLTGAAANAVGEIAVVSMGTATDSVFATLEQSGFAVCERVVRFPFWDEYGDMIKSDIADLKNVGGPVAGAITAGKFLEHFTKSPWVHLDISGSAFLKTDSSYRGKGGSAFGVRLLYKFVRDHYRC